MGEGVGIPVLDRPVWGLSDAELVSCLDAVFAQEQALAAKRLSLIAEIDARGLGAREGARTTAVWLRHRLRIDPSAARQMTSLAQGLDKILPETAQALAAGRLHLEQARVIHRAMSELPAELGTQLHARAEQTLTGYAAEFCPAQLSVLGARILEHVAPEVAERHERERLERGEARAWSERGFSLIPDGPGRVRLSGCLDTESAATVGAALDSLCSPRGSKVTADLGDGALGDADGGPRGGIGAGTGSGGIGGSTDGRACGGIGGGTDGRACGGIGGGTDSGGARGGIGGGAHAGTDSGAHGGTDERTATQRRADALVQLSRVALASGDLPAHGGQRPQVTVVMPYQPWQERTVDALGQLDNGHRVTPQTLRRMACDADVIPVVLGTDGQPLDVGRVHRLFPAALRRVLNVRDRGCAFPACDRPPAWCDCHHIVPWFEGGVTSVDNGVLLCRRHHVLIHEGDWIVRPGPDRLPEFVPPSYVDKEQRPRRNRFHSRVPDVAEHQT